LIDENTESLMVMEDADHIFIEGWIMDLQEAPETYPSCPLQL